MKRKLLALLVSAVLLTGLLTACGGAGKSSGGGSYYATSNSTAAAPSAEMADYGGNDWYEEPMAMEQSAAVSTQPQKMIFTASLEMETDAFEETTASLAELTNRLGGYFADSSIGNRGSGYRWANYTIRVPVQNFQEFLNQAGGLCHETWRSTSQEDVSEYYYDTQGRLRTQQIKLERLQSLLEQAEQMEDIITIESAISETEQIIESLSGTLRHYDNLVDYSTINLSLNEVYKFSNVEEVPDSFASRLWSSFKEGLSDFGDWLEDIVVALAYGWLWIVIVVIVIVIVVRLAGRGSEKRREARAAKKAAKQAERTEKLAARQAEKQSDKQE